jgi:AcrR family transcriptional regulator
MRSSLITRASQSKPAPAPDSRFDRRLSEILSHATGVFCDKGYKGASMRDLSRASGMSLAGLYHYFGSKERLLYLIQKHTFSTIVEELKKRLAGVADPAERIRIFIQNHLEYFVTNQSGLKVLAHEDEALKNGFNSEVAAIKREYYRICLGLMEDLKRKHKLDFNSRTTVMSLFGMINWIYTWYKPRHDGTAEALAQQMSTIILSGVGYQIKPSRSRRGETYSAKHRQTRSAIKPKSSGATRERSQTRRRLSRQTARRRSRGRAGNPQSAASPASKKVLKGRAFRRAASRF